MKNRNWFWGIFFLLAAVYIIGMQFGSFAQIGVLSIVASIFLIAIIVQSLVRLNFFGIFVPLALLYLIFRQPLGLVELSGWLLVLSAVFASIGFGLIFHRSPNRTCHSRHDSKHYNATIENIDDNNPFTKVSFGEASKYLHADSLKSGQFILSFGSMQLFFDQATLSPDGAELFLDCSFGSMELYIPKHWKVTDNLNRNLGGVEFDARSIEPGENAPRLTLNGSVRLGNVEIHYI